MRLILLKRLSLVAICVGLLALAASCFFPQADIVELPAASGVVGSSGGEVRVDDPDSELNGVSVSVPEGAVAEKTSITVDASSELPPLPAGSEVVAPPVGISVTGRVTRMRIALPVCGDDRSSLAAGGTTYTAAIRRGEGVPWEYYQAVEEAGTVFVELESVGYSESVRTSAIGPKVIEPATLNVCVIAQELLEMAVLRSQTVNTGFSERDRWRIWNTSEYISAGSTETGLCLGMVAFARWYYSLRRLPGNGYLEPLSERWSTRVQGGAATAMQALLGYSLERVLNQVVSDAAGSTVEALALAETISQMKLTGLPVVILNAEYNHALLAVYWDGPTGTLGVYNPNNRYIGRVHYDYITGETRNENVGMWSQHWSPYRGDHSELAVLIYALLATAQGEMPGAYPQALAICSWDGVTGSGGQPLRVGQQVVVDGSTSTDPNGDPAALQFSWRLSSPAGSQASLTTYPQSTRSNARLNPDKPGSYIIEMTARDPEGLESSDAVFLWVAPEDPPALWTSETHFLLLDGEELEIVVGVNYSEPSQPAHGTVHRITATPVDSDDNPVGEALVGLGEGDLDAASSEVVLRLGADDFLGFGQFWLLLSCESETRFPEASSASELAPKPWPSVIDRSLSPLRLALTVAPSISGVWRGTGEAEVDLVVDSDLEVEETQQWSGVVDLELELEVDSAGTVSGHWQFPEGTQVISGDAAIQLSLGSPIQITEAAFDGEKLSLDTGLSGTATMSDGSTSVQVTYSADAKFFLTYDAASGKLVGSGTSRTASTATDARGQHWATTNGTMQIRRIQLRR